MLFLSGSPEILISDNYLDIMDVDKMIDIIIIV